MKVIFMGTPKFAVPSLEMLMKHHEVLAVVTQPDKPKGRGKKMLFPPIKEVALAHEIEVLQPEKVKDPEFIDKLRSYGADIFIVVAFGRILPVDILEIPKYGCINVHGSLLPKYRGAAPMQWAVINGEKETGITTMYMAKGLDSGDMLLKRELPITDEDTYGTVHDAMCILGAGLLKETLEGLELGTIQKEEQDHEKFTYAPMISKETGHIDWSKNCEGIRNLIRGLDPSPNAYTIYGEEILKIWKASKTENEYPHAQIGEVVEITKQGFVVKAANGGLLITEVQARGGKRMATDAYMRGHEVKVGTILR